MNKIKTSKILIVGVGGLGSSVLTLLARLGVGTIFIVDPKKVDIPDLNRQILYDLQDIEKYKVIVAKEKVEKIRKDLKIYSMITEINENFDIPNVDIIFDCLDNFKSRLILYDKGCEKNIPVIHGGVEGFYGQVTVVKQEVLERFKSFLEKTEEKEIRQIFPPIVTTIASMQVNEYMKITCGYENILIGKILCVDLKNMFFEIIEY